MKKVAYWPGCVSRGFTPELHGSMEQVAPLLDWSSSRWTGRAARVPASSPSTTRSWPTR